MANTKSKTEKCVGDYRQLLIRKMRLFAFNSWALTFVQNDVLQRHPNMCPGVVDYIFSILSALIKSTTASR